MMIGGNQWAYAPVFQPEEMNVPSLIRRYMELFDECRRTEAGMRKALEWVDRAKNCETREESDECIDGAKLIMLITLMREDAGSASPSFRETDAGER